MVEKIKQAKCLEDYNPGASRKQIFGALGKVAKASKPNGNGKISSAKREQTEDEAVNRAIAIVIKRHLGAFKELERY